MFSTSMVSQTSAIKSRLEIFSIESNKREVLFEENAHFEAPNWGPDGSYFIINQDGMLYKISLDGQRKEVIPTGFAENCNNDHGISADGNWLAISNNDKIEGSTSGTSRIYILPIQGGTPKLVTPEMPSYWHGWSPDGNFVVYTALRNGAYDIYRISIDGQDEIRLTEAPGLDDGPEYSPDGKYIYFNSFQSGSMELWRMKNDGSDKEQLTSDVYSNWFPHPSPDGQYLVFLSYLEDQKEGHPAMKEVALRLYRLKDKSIRTLCVFIGGQGTINVPSWSPDSKKFAFVSYQDIP
jgi:Tol biopolymer transport system component